MGFLERLLSRLQDRLSEHNKRMEAKAARRLPNWGAIGPLFDGACAGDYGPLITWLRSGGTITPEVRSLVIYILQNSKPKKPPHRQAELVTALRRMDMAGRVRELEKAGWKTEAALVQVGSEFHCSDKTVRNALTATRLEFEKAQQKITSFENELREAQAKLASLVAEGCPDHHLSKLRKHIAQMQVERDLFLPLKERAVAALAPLVEGKPPT